LWKKTQLEFRAKQGNRLVFVYGGTAGEASKDGASRVVIANALAGN
jgi:hypothetical protein